MLVLNCCRLPVKPVLRSSSSVQEQSTTRISSSESLVSSSYEQLPASEEPYYDIVPAEDETTSDHSSTENVFSTSSTLPLASKHNSLQNVQEPQSPGTSNYVNIEYFIQYVFILYK